jgi:hypothetical protein
MTSLTDRYVAATLRSIPSNQRGDIERELRTSIADALEDQTELEALSALGDPNRLAASYADRPLHLIGPAVYLDYRRVLAILLSSVVPLIFVASGVGSFQGSPSLLGALASATSTALLVAMHLVLWTTLVFVIIDRAFARIGRRAGAWNPATLPELPAKRIDLGSVIGGSLLTAVIAAVLIVMQATGPGLISPSLWDSGALLLVIIFAAAAIAFDVIGYYVGWGIPQAISNAALSVLFVGCVVGVARGGELVNPAFFEAVGWPAGAGADGVVTWIIIAVMVLLSIGNVSGGFARARRSRARA